MGLSFGWRANDTRESIWKDDTALSGVPAGALEAWMEDGDASHLEPYATQGEPTRIKLRSLTPDEKQVATAPFTEAETKTEGYYRTIIRCFRIGVDFVGIDPWTQDAEGNRRSLYTKERGVRMLANEAVTDIEVKYPGLVAFYGRLVFEASFPNDAEKKASSPPSTGTPSPAAGSTEATTAPSPPAGAVTGAP